MNEIRYFSMFTGVGGFELGIQRAISNRTFSKTQTTNIQGEQPSSPTGMGDGRQSSSFSCVGFSEIDKYASQLLAQRFPGIKNYGDATKINPAELPDFDMLCGGFPCQSFSIAGKRKGFKDTRGTMFFEVARILEAKRPKLVFLENVKGLLNHNQGQTFSIILQTLEELGYVVQWMVLNSKFHGVPQNRERVFIIGSLRGQPRPEILPFTINNREITSSGQSQNAGTLCGQYAKNPTDGSYVIHNVYGGFGEGIREKPDIVPTLRTPKGGGHLPMIAIPVLTPDRAEKRQNGRRFKENGEESFTLTKTDIHGVMTVANCVTPDAYLQKGERKRVNGKSVLTSVHERRIRRLTPIECERLQGFPDGWTSGFSDTQRYKMMGNAVTVNVIRAIASKLFHNPEKSEHIQGRSINGNTNKNN